MPRSKPSSVFVESRHTKLSSITSSPHSSLSTLRKYEISSCIPLRFGCTTFFTSSWSNAPLLFTSKELVTTSRPSYCAECSNYWAIEPQTRMTLSFESCSYSGYRPTTHSCTSDATSLRNLPTTSPTQCHQPLSQKSPLAHHHKKSDNCVHRSPP